MPAQIEQIVSIWLSGGWTMIPLVALALFTYGLAAQMFLYFGKRGYLKVPASTWAEWIEDPSKGEGEIGEIIRYAQDEAVKVSVVQDRFSEIIASKIPDMDRRIQLLNVMVSAAPLLGLLGTVLGMLTTFEGISVGGSKTIDLIARGISEALITTEMGLLVALPGYAMTAILKSHRNRYEAVLAHMESRTIQKFTLREVEEPEGVEDPEFDNLAPATA